ncbi:Sua5/YciO/YrdC/YwlC family protein [Cryomorpha ignava]|uniref:Sua5/YciO/YrdC/YwlC family protein n=1 Tax=Cryomorpha ignava TaxID=101383 RepID=A0A7K3WNQ0_9FLAO|nr:Sua5/YciO/YrdC/YwlC family protein [Cryomorpha ignava]NEN23114.1 Sua5/YciO/YrdC/YwlC family protein [Cryomorpha ignava]
MIEITIKEAPLKIKDGAIILTYLEDSISLICDARNSASVDHLRKLKKRKADKGFTILMDSDARVNKYVHDVPPLAWDIFDTADSPIILVLPGGRDIAKNALAADGTIAVRMVTSMEERKLVQAANGPVAATALLKADGSLARTIEEGDTAILDEIEYVLTLPPGIKSYSMKKIPIIYLDLASNVKIIRE